MVSLEVSYLLIDLIAIFTKGMQIVKYCVHANDFVVELIVGGSRNKEGVAVSDE